MDVMIQLAPALAPMLATYTVFNVVLATVAPRAIKFLVADVLFGMINDCVIALGSWTFSSLVEYSGTLLLISLFGVTPPGRQAVRAGVAAARAPCVAMIRVVLNHVAGPGLPM
jgi:hypothetical protein